MSPRTGRPKVDDPHKRVVSVRLTEQEHEACVEAAQKSGQRLGAWMRASAVIAVKRAKR
jgi:hypothetical protein